MAKNSVEAYQAEGKTNLLLHLPENLTIVGLDCPEDECPELADPDRLEPGDEFEGLVRSMLDHGFVGSVITVRKVRGSERVYVVHGRQRTLAAREANRRMRKADPRALPLRVKTMIDDSSDLKRSAAVNVVANEHVRAVTPLAKARAAERMRAMGYDDDEIARMYSVTKTTLRGWSNLLSAPPDLLAQVERGEVSASTAKAVGKLPEDEKARGAEIVREAIRAEGKDGGKVRERVRATAGTKKTEDTPGPIWTQKHLVSFRDFMNPAQNAADDPADEVQRAIYHFLRVATGEVSAEDCRGFAGMCPDDSGGRLADWVRGSAPNPRKA